MKALLLILVCIVGCELEFPARQPAILDYDREIDIKMTEQEIARNKKTLIPLDSLLPRMVH